jgi:hypothetical protein
MIRSKLESTWGRGEVGKFLYIVLFLFCICTCRVLFIERMLAVIALQMKVKVLTERMTSTNPGTNRFSPWNVMRSSAPSDSAQYWYCMTVHTNKTNYRSGDKRQLVNDTVTNDTPICALTDITLVVSA